MSYPRKEYNRDQPKKYWSLAEAKVRIASYCAYQERYQQEVRNKLHERGIYGEEAEELIAFLISEGYLNEERFAQAFVSGKFRIKKWGRNKILQELKLRHISPNCIKSGMKEIDEEEYWETLLLLVEKKASMIKESDDFKKRYKTHQYLMGRGFENDLIQSAIETVFSKQNL
ncbi:regulatory protein RecX [Aquiflexum sp.]|uniref:regulatory protein RecX n=1 Tax=Aquiflexum sp. TaxID=1872584 RepID=UPI003593501E